MKTVKFIPNPQVGLIDAIVLLSYENRVVLLAQERMCVAALDGEIYRPYPELQGLDLYYFIQYGNK